MKEFLEEHELLTDVENALNVLSDAIRTALLHYLREKKIAVDEEKFPQLIEREIMMTPKGSRPQDPHADTRHNIVAAFISLNKGPTKSTFIASSIKFPAGTSMKTLEYKQLDVPSSHTNPHVFLNHATWPHHGPGNKSTKVDRYMLFCSFALDETAFRHTTAEAVLRNI